MNKTLTAGALALALLAGVGAAPAQTLRIGLAEDPDILDPTLARTFVGRIVFSALCDKLIDITPDLKLVPRLATEWNWSADEKSLTVKLRPDVLFHDGEKLDAAAAKYSLERHLTLPGSFRRAEIRGIKAIEVLDPLTFRIDLEAPFAPLVAQLTDRAGMMVSPKAARAMGDKFGTAPVCTGPFKFVERVAQDRIVLERFEQYWEKDKIHLQRIEYRPIIDNTVRLANLKSGQLDFIERVAATDLDDVRKDRRFKLSSIVELGYQGITINMGNGARAKGPMGNPKVREALELSLDRQALIQVVFNGEFEVGNQWISPGNAAYNKAIPVPKRDVAKARALLREAGHPNPTIEFMVATTGEAQQVAQVIQSMTKEAGFDLKIRATEFASSLKLAEQGDFEIYYLGWSGRTDPDGNLVQFITCGSPNNNSGHCNQEVEKLILASRSTNDLAKRREAWHAIARVTLTDRPIVYLFHRKWFWAYANKVSGLVEYPDGLVRVHGLKVN
ncbi:MAG: ABC transporter substrate-binding protein [Alphaproteobacteria bacterium]|nr:ABC transporter substrate-binding protein [Alphaproteobacteria bacterium]